MDLSSRWDRFAGFFILLLAIAAMVGCLALQSNQSTSSGTVSVASTNLDLGTAVVGVLPIRDCRGVALRNATRLSGAGT